MNPGCLINMLNTVRFHLFQLIMQKIRILFVTDIHSSVQNVQKLSEYLVEENIRFDHVVCCGDIANVHHNASRRNSDNKDKEETEAVLNGLAKFNGKAHLIPGNHDVNELFEGISLPDNLINFHCSKVQLAQDLVMLGCGGSCDSYYTHVENKIAYQGYPFNGAEGDSKLGAALSNTFKKVKLKPDTQVLLVTHQGPSECSTTDIYPEPGQKNGYRNRIESGSQGIRDTVLKQKSILALVHGHSHFSWGSAKLGKVPVINPGPLQNGRFLLLTLAKDDEEGSLWSVQSISFHNLLL